LEVLQAYAKRLGLTVSGKRKQELIDDIQAVRRDMDYYKYKKNIYMTYIYF